MIINGYIYATNQFRIALRERYSHQQIFRGYKHAFFKIASVSEPNLLQCKGKNIKKYIGVAWS